MSIPDPLAPFEHGPLHRLDIAIAESVTGVRGRSISRHLVQPAVEAGARPRNAIAVLHWGLLLAGAAGVAWGLSQDRTRR